MTQEDKRLLLIDLSGRLPYNMKKIILILFTIFLVIGCTDKPVIGDKYVVTEVSRCSAYGLKYYVRMDCCNKYQAMNYHKFYTNKLYTVGDTIKIR